MIRSVELTLVGMENPVLPCELENGPSLPFSRSSGGTFYGVEDFTTFRRLTGRGKLKSIADEKPDLVMTSKHNSMHSDHEEKIF
jgi:hypothetical protein